MTIIQKIKDDSLTARKQKETIRASLLTTLYAEAVKIGKDAGNRETTDEETIAVIKKFIKNNEETHKAHVIHNKIDQKVGIESEILKSYLPKQLSKNELETIIKSLNTKNIGEIMKHLKDNYAGLYDAKAASEIAKSI